MGKLLKNNFRILFHNYFMLGALAILLVLCNVVEFSYLFSPYDTAEPFLYLKQAMEVAIPLFVFFLFFSYEYFTRAKDAHLDETAASVYGGRLKLYLSQSMVLVVLALVFTVMSLAYSIAYYFIYEVNNAVYFWHIFINYFLNVFLSSIAAVLLALLCSLWLKRVAAYGLLILLSFLATPFSDGTISLLSHRIELYLAIDLTLAKNYLSILGQSVFMPDYNYGLPLEQFRWSLIFFYLCLLFLLCLWQLKAHRRKIARWGMAVLCAGVLFFAYGILTPGSLQRMHPDINNFGIPDSTYYAFYAEEKKEKAQFSITSYNMVFDIEKELSATVTMKLENGESDGRYIFTLYHYLNIQSVTDGEGNALSYTRDGDYIEIGSTQELDTIVIRYHGSYPSFYSNSQGMWLAGNLYYYPIEGYHVIWDYYNPWFNFDSTLGDKEFTVKVNSPLTVYCNLGGENNSFSGRQKAVTLAGGMFYQEYETDYFTAYKSPVSSTNLDQYSSLKEVLKGYEALVGAKVELGEKIKLFFASMPVANGDKNEIVSFGDHVLILKPWPVDQVAAHLLISNLPGDTKKDTLRYGLLSYLINRTQTIASVDATFQNSDTFQLPQGYSKENLEQYDIDCLETKFWMNKKVKTMSEKSFYSKIYAFLADENDHTPELEFIKNLK